VTITVEENGIGVAQEFLPRMFDRFEQSEEGKNRRFGGLGLGLALVKSYVNLHHGEVSAWSKGPGHGCTITVKLPFVRKVSNRLPSDPTEALQQNIPGRSVSETSEANLPLKGYRVLIVEDDPFSLDLAAHVFRGQGAEVVEAYTAESALESIRTVMPDLVVSDIGLPGMDGFDFIRALRRFERSNNHRQTPSLAISAFVSRRDQQEAQDAGYNAYVAKPIDVGELQRMAIKAIAGIH
jgi:CheY-like chemotaxis protein